MICTADADKPHKDSCSYPTASDEGAFLSLVQECPLPCFEMNVAILSSSYYVSPPALCFEDPFDDPSMEPMPLGPNTF
jgi:hypothetical protein